MGFNLGGLLAGSGGKSSNTYTSPNLDFLKAGTPQVNYDFLRDYATQSGGLAGRGKSYLDYIQPTGMRQDVGNATLQNTLGNIERDAGQRFGTDIMEKYARGLIGGGAQSDIAANSLAQIATGAGRTAADAYTNLAGQNLDYARGASQDYNQLLAQGEQMQGGALQNYAQGLSGNANLTMEQRQQLSNALLQNAQGQSAGYRPGDYGMLGQFANSFAGGAGTGASALLFCFIGETPVEMADGSTVEIKNIEPGDVTAGGTVIETRKSMTDDLYEYRGVRVSGSHCVRDGDSWKRVRDADGAESVPGVFTVYNLVTENHRIFVFGSEFDDATEYPSTAEHLEYLNGEAVHAGV